MVSSLELRGFGGGHRWKARRISLTHRSMKPNFLRSLYLHFKISIFVLCKSRDNPHKQLVYRKDATGLFRMGDKKKASVLDSVCFFTVLSEIQAFFFLLRVNPERGENVYRLKYNVSPYERVSSDNGDAEELREEE